MSASAHKTYVENIEGGYRMWCEPCGVEEKIPIGLEGMPIEAFLAWCNSFRRRHPERRKRKS